MQDPDLRAPQNKAAKLRLRRKVVPEIQKKPRLVPPGHLGSLHFFSGPTPFITKSLLKSRVANLQPTKMSQYRLGNPDAHVPPSLNKGARPQKHVIVSSCLGSGGPKVISSF